MNPTPLTDGNGHFSGTVDGKKWSVDFDNEHCYYILWSCGFASTYPWDEYASLTANETPGQPDDYTLFVRKDVAHARITLGDGEVLSLEAVPVAKVPVMLFALPPGLGVGEIELFDARGSEIAYSLPFAVKGSASVSARWYKPGERPPAASGSMELTRGSGVFATEVITAYVGPSGPCVEYQAAGRTESPECLHGSLSGSQVLHVTHSGGSAGPAPGGDSGTGIVAPNVDHLELDFSDGSKSPLPIKSLGGYRFYAYIVPEGKNISGVTAFDSAGKALPVQNTVR